MSQSLRGYIVKLLIFVGLNNSHFGAEISLSWVGVRKKKSKAVNVGYSTPLPGPTNKKKKEKKKKFEFTVTYLWNEQPEIGKCFMH